MLEDSQAIVQSFKEIYFHPSIQQPTNLLFKCEIIVKGTSTFLWVETNKDITKSKTSE